MRKAKEPCDPQPTQSIKSTEEVPEIRWKCNGEKRVSAHVL